MKRKGKTLRAVKQSGEPVRLHQAGDEFQEAAWVVDRIASLPGRRRAAVLFRMNAQSRLFEEALLRQGMPYLVVGGVGFYERKEVKDIVSYLRLVQNPHDPLALRRVLNVPARGIGARTLDEIAARGRAAADLPVGGAGRGGDGGAPARAGHPAPARASAS